MIEFKSVNLKLASNIILSDISFVINKGELVCIAAKTGSGKTSLIKMILKNIEVSGGNILIEGVDINSINFKNLQYFRRRVGAVLQTPCFLWKKTVKENLIFVLYACGMTISHTKIANTLENLNLLKTVNKYPYELSHGERQRLSIACAIIHDPNILLLDEPTSNLDPESLESILYFLLSLHKKSDITILMTTHSKDVIEFFKPRVLHIKDTRLVMDKKVSKYKEITQL